MTNKEKFKEVFGLEIDDSADCGFFDCSDKLCKDCPVKETKSWWNTEYMPPQSGTWVNMSYEAYVDLLSQTVEQEPRWIPVSEKLPNDRDWYLGIFKEPDTGWINSLPFICDYVGSKTKATTKEHWILRGFTDIDEPCDYYFNLECVAWMPLPKPYKPQESED